MAPQRRLRPHERLQLLGASIARVPLKEAAHRMNIPYSTAKYTKKQASLRYKNQADLQYSGRPRKVINQEIQRLYRQIKIDNSIFWSSLLDSTPFSESTI